MPVSWFCRRPARWPRRTRRIAVLRNGFTIQSARHEVEGKTARLWLCASAGSGYLEVPSEQIAGFEPGPSTVPEERASAPGTGGSGSHPARESIGPMIVSAASRHQIDPDFLASVVKAESGFNAAAVSPKGARGLMQLMPQTAATLGVADSFDPAANLEAGTKYLRQLLDRYHGDAIQALAAYNAGPRRVERVGGIPNNGETPGYVARIIEDFNGKVLRQRAQSAAAAAGQ